MVKKDLVFNKNFSCEYGVIDHISPLVRRIVANNPGPYTFRGTGTYIVGHGEVAVIDPGPDDERHVDSLISALGNEKITHQLITHTHNDHSPAAKAVKRITGAKTFGFGPHGFGKHGKGHTVEAGGDLEFTPDVYLKDGDIVKGKNWTIASIHTPGHTSNHLCYHLIEENALFSGDHVMGWSTTVVSPPDGDMSNYMKSLRKLAERNDIVYYPTHGAPIMNPQAFVRAIAVHRKMRERQILECLDNNRFSITLMVTYMYKDLDSRLMGAAKHSIYAHIIDLTNRGIVKPKDQLSIDAHFIRV